jgi:hypothetical protein
MTLITFLCNFKPYGEFLTGVPLLHGKNVREVIAILLVLIFIYAIARETWDIRCCAIKIFIH